MDISPQLCGGCRVRGHLSLKQCEACLDASELAIVISCQGFVLGDLVVSHLDARNQPAA